MSVAIQDGGSTAGLQVFDIEGAGIRFGMTEDGTPYSIASDYAKTMGYRQTKNALDLLDEGEKGFALTETPGGRQRLAVIFEDGMWELIFRSTLPGAKAIKSRVKAILREIRETGRYEVQPRETSRKDLALMVLAAEEEKERLALANQELTEHVAELEPAAKAWDVMASSNGDHSLRDAAYILNRDPGISTGPRLLKGYLADFGMIDRRGIPYSKHKTHLVQRARTYEHPHTGEEMQAQAQLRVTYAGLKYLHRRLGGVAPLRFEQMALRDAG